MIVLMQQGDFTAFFQFYHSNGNTERDQAQQAHPLQK
jgi:hypothetical protein